MYILSQFKKSLQCQRYCNSPNNDTMVFSVQNPFRRSFREWTFLTWSVAKQARGPGDRALAEMTEGLRSALEHAIAESEGGLDSILLTALKTCPQQWLGLSPSLQRRCGERAMNTIFIRGNPRDQVSPQFPRPGSRQRVQAWLGSPYRVQATPRLSAEEEAVSPGREGAQVGQPQEVMALWDTSRVEATPKLTPPLQPPQHQLAWLGVGGSPEICLDNAPMASEPEVCVPDLWPKTQGPETTLVSPPTSGPDQRRLQGLKLPEAYVPFSNSHGGTL